MLSKNEWDPLVRVVVGVADHARIPSMDLSLRVINYADADDSRVPPVGLYPQQVIDEANEDLEVFCDFLQKCSVEVLRPDRDCQPGYYNYCPRDSVLVHDDLILATPQPLRARHNEYQAMDQHFRPYVLQGQRYVVKMAEKTDALYDPSCIGNRDRLALTNVEPAFDAANVLRDNDNLYYLISNGGNRAGALYLQELVGDAKKVWLVENVYSFMHIDSTMALLREGLMLLNPSRIKDVSQLPPPLQNWDVIWAPDPGNFSHYPGYCNASPWLNVNLFSVTPNLVAMVSGQTALRHRLEAHGIDCMELPGRHQRTLGGGFHCVTLDLERKHV